LDARHSSVSPSQAVNTRKRIAPLRFALRVTRLARGDDAEGVGRETSLVFDTPTARRTRNEKKVDRISPTDPMT